LIDSVILSKVNPPSENHPRRGAAAAVVGILLLAGCMPSAPPEDMADAPPAATLSPATTPPISGRIKTFAALDLPLDPLASKDQLLRSFQQGRKDPFGNVIVTQKMSLAKAAEAEAGTVAGAAGLGAAGSGVSGQAGASPGVKDAACDSLKRDIQITGLIHGAGSSEAIVFNTATGETGSLRPGDRGGRSTTLIPNGCQVQSIDVNAGYLVITPVKKGPPVPLYL